MNLYLIRHGDAEAISESGKDFDRKLTHAGIEQMKLAAQGWQSLIDQFDVIVASPLVRAVETARIISDVFNYKKDIMLDNNLISGGSTSEVVILANSLNLINVAMIGHQPDLSQHTSRLISNANASIAFEKGTIAKISFPNSVIAGKGVLKFLIPAESF
ncbi:MAG: phosphohistidine phosphatase SixA [Ignavibacteriales bacterium]|nr:MAG: phosphohistidine phosphatase SixA [Ignavibacteriales bacterium]